MSVIVVGGAGALGRALINRLSSAINQPSYQIISIDLVENDSAQLNLSAKSSFSTLKSQIAGPIQAIYAVAGSWEGGNAATEGILKRILFLRFFFALIDLEASLERLWASNVKSALLACHLAASLPWVSGGGVLCLTSAKASLSACPTMLAYGACKQAVNQLVKGMAASGSGLPGTVKVCAMLPEVLDTPANRRDMPQADTGSWTPLDTLTE